MKRTLAAWMFLVAIGCGSGVPSVPSADPPEPPGNLVKKIKDPQLPVEARVDAMRVLGAQGTKSPEVIDALTDALADKSSAVRQRAISSLLQLGGKSALPSLKKLGKGDVDPKVRESAQAAIETLEALP